ncbi:hypothetical protein ATP_00413 [Candidatus Phytoplasma mali]|uniref:Uncharacterized protein n=1 Tax=Phytoplasma mali (strain AT) TaxID=482235 RepID=B3QZJ3_PHYMT|nr:hypothetical protein [Candidatus Phytoplasma mali]CAP18600.1 hypothetical protein ATP_00413 [Candidatus Phytoplasma mali]
MNFKQTLLTLIGILIGVLIILIFYYQNTGNSSQLPVLSPDSNLPNSNPINHKTIIDENVSNHKPILFDENVSNHEPLITSKLDNAETKIIPILITENEFNLIINYIENATMTKIPEFIQDQVQITKINEIKESYQKRQDLYRSWVKSDLETTNRFQEKIDNYKKEELDINNKKEKIQKIIQNLKNQKISHDINTKILQQENEINYLNKNLKNLNLVKTDLEQNYQRYQKTNNDNNKYRDNCEKQNTKERLLKIYTIKS